MTTQNQAIAVLFPGQGSQYPGMSKVLVGNFTWTRSFFEEASDAIKVDLLKLCSQGPSEELQLTANAQPCILVTSYSWFQVLKQNLGFRPAAGAGHSLGEYSALVSSQALSLADAVNLVRKRGELMQSAVPAGKGKMSAVIGLDDDRVRDICTAASSGKDSLVVPANFNAPSQVVIAGHAEAVDKFAELASGTSNPQWKARKIISLNVSAPFHCPLMAEMASSFLPFLENTQWSDPQFPIVSNLDAKLRNTGNVSSILKDQIDHPVLWTSCVQTLERHGIKTFIEMGPSRVLSGLVKRIVEGAMSFSIDSLEDFQKLESALKEMQNAVS